MASSGTSGRPTNSGSKAFDFASDDILCSYEDENNGIHSDPSISANSAKQDFQRSRVARSSVFPSATYNNPPEESSFNQDVMTSVDKTMKKYTDNLLRFLEGISSRLSQLELYCYNLDKSIGEMRSDLVGDHEESDSKLKSLDKHIQEVHRSVQILRDKQELADTQKELAKLQLGQKEPSSLTNNNTQQNEDRSSPHTYESSQKSEDSSDAYGKQLVLHQVAPQPPPPTRPVEHQQPSFPTQNMTQVHGYYLAPQQMTNMPPSQPQPSQIQYLQPQSQIQDPSRMMAPQPTQTPQVNQSPQVHYQLQWSNQPQPQPQPQPPQQQQVMQPQMRPSSQMVYSSYMPSNQATQSPAEMAPSSMPMQPGSAGPEHYGYGVTGRPVQLQSTEGYMTSGPRTAVPPGNTYVMFDSEGGRVHPPPPPSQHNFQQGAYPPNPQRMTNANILIPQSPRNHPYNELIEKLVSMGYRSDHVVGLIQRLEESGQHVDFNTVLDRLNGGGNPTGAPQRAWSG